MKRKWSWLFCLIGMLLLFPVLSSADIVYEGKSYPKDAVYISLEDQTVTDFDKFISFLDQFPNLLRVDMWENRMTLEQCDLLAGRFPDMTWGWTLVISARDHEHLIRTDATSFSTLHNSASTQHTSEDFSILKYCPNLMALDIGHNNVTDLSFLYGLPKLRVLIIACNHVTDITPIGSLKDLEYAEIFKNNIEDLTPLSGLTHLLDLNICFNHIKDFSPLKGLTNLKRLWMYSASAYSAEPPRSAVEELKAALPDTEIDSTHYSTAGAWRYLSENHPHPHYQAILQMFGEDHLHPHSEYVPFEDSFPLDPEEEGDIIPEIPTVGTELVPSLKLLEQQDFSDRGYLLPIDYSIGSKPEKSNYLSAESYADSTISVTVSTGNTGSCLYWMCDIRLQDASQLRTMSASRTGDFMNENAEMSPMNLSQRSGAVAAISGDFWSSSEKRGLGYIVRQGVLYRYNLDESGRPDSHMMDVLLIDEDGDFHGLHCPERGSVPGRIDGKRILQSFSFGPILVEDGKVPEDFGGADTWINMAQNDPRQRMCICQTGPLSYKIVCCAGPYKGNTGMTLREFAELVASLNVQTAYNLDGGDSTWLYFNGAKVNEMGISSQRKLRDIIYFASAEGQR